MIGNDALDIVKRTPTGDYGPLGLPVITESTVTVTGCSLQADTSVENRDSVGTVVTVRATAYLPITTDTTALGPNDAIRHDGKTWELQGPAITVRDLSDNHHVRCELKWQAG